MMYREEFRLTIRILKAKRPQRVLSSDTKGERENKPHFGQIIRITYRVH